MLRKEEILNIITLQLEENKGIYDKFFCDKIDFKISNNCKIKILCKFERIKEEENDLSLSIYQSGTAIDSYFESEDSEKDEYFNKTINNVIIDRLCHRMISETIIKPLSKNCYKMSNNYAKFINDGYIMDINVKNNLKTFEFYVDGDDFNLEVNVDFSCKIGKMVYEDIDSLQ